MVQPKRYAAPIIAGLGPGGSITTSMADSDILNFGPTYRFVKKAAGFPYGSRNGTLWDVARGESVKIPSGLLPRTPDLNSTFSLLRRSASNRYSDSAEGVS